MSESIWPHDLDTVREAAGSYEAVGLSIGGTRLAHRYRETEIGAIPEDWDLKPLKEVAEIRTGIAKNARAVISDAIDVHYLRVANVQDGFLDLKEMKRIKVAKSDVQHFAVLPGDVLMNEGGDLDKLGRGALWRGEFQPCVHQNHVFVVRSRPVVDAAFLAAWSAHDVSRKYFSVAGKQTTNLASINKTALGGLPIVIPPINEQRAIATALSDADALIDVLDRLIAKKRAIKQATQQQLLTGQTRLPGFTGEWEMMPLGDVLGRVMGGGTPARSNPNFWGGDIPWVTVKDLSSFDSQRAQEYITPEGLLHSASNLVPAGTLITSTRMALGQAVIYDVDVCINQDLKALFCDSRLEPRFLYYWFESNAVLINELGSGSTVKGLSVADLRNIYFLLPTNPEQTAIATVLADMDAEIEALQRRRNKARQIKQGMMQQLLTGRVRLVKPVPEECAND